MHASPTVELCSRDGKKLEGLGEGRGEGKGSKGGEEEGEGSYPYLQFLDPPLVTSELIFMAYCKNAA